MSTKSEHQINTEQRIKKKNHKAGFFLIFSQQFEKENKQHKQECGHKKHKL